MPATRKSAALASPSFAILANVSMKADRRGVMAGPGQTFSNNQHQSPILRTTKVVRRASGDLTSAAAREEWRRRHAPVGAASKTEWLMRGRCLSPCKSLSCGFNIH